MSTQPIKPEEPLDLNSASEAALSQLAGVGADRARALVESRPFDYWSELRRVPGFSASLIVDLKDAGVRLEPVR